MHSLNSPLKTEPWTPRQRMNSLAEFMSFIVWTFAGFGRKLVIAGSFLTAAEAGAGADLPAGWRYALSTLLAFWRLFWGGLYGFTGIKLGFSFGMI